VVCERSTGRTGAVSITPSAYTVSAECYIVLQVIGRKPMHIAAELYMVLPL
jgi:hypothetical protein